MFLNNGLQQELWPNVLYISFHVYPADAVVPRFFFCLKYTYVTPVAIHTLQMYVYWLRHVYKDVSDARLWMFAILDIF